MTTDALIESSKTAPIPFTSRYANTPIYTDAGSSFRSTYNQKRVEPSDSDKIVLVKAEDAGRLDLIAARVYGDPKMYWVIAEANYITNPISEVIAGMEIRIPPAQRSPS